jgi:hypothetical protein
MRQTVIVLLALGLVATAFTGAHAGSLMNETFTYPDGGLVANSGGNWTTHSGTGDILVVSNAAVGLMSNGADDNRLLSSARTATDKTYACFNLTIPSQTIVTNYIAHFMVNATTFRSKVFVAPSGSSFTLGLSVTANQTGTPPAPPAPPVGATWATDLNFGQTYKVAISYDAVGGVSEMWVDPLNEASTKVTATDAAAAAGALTAFGLRQSNTNGSAFTYTVDDLSVGTTFTDACGGPVAVEARTWGVMKTTYR